MTNATPGDDPQSAPAPLLRWVSVGAGRLALTHRPKLRGMPQFRAEGCARLVTLLAAREGAERIGALAQEAGLAWTWLPLDSGRPPTDEAAWSQVAQGLIALAARLDAGESLALHCSAGIHRTGMIAYALLRVSGYPSAQALTAIEADAPRDTRWPARRPHPLRRHHRQADWRGRVAVCGWLEGFPLFARDASLLEDALKQWLADVTLVRIRQINTSVAAFHVW